MPRIPKIAQRKAAETMPKKTESRIRIPLVTMTDHWIPSRIPRYAIGRGIKRNTIVEKSGM